LSGNLQTQINSFNIIPGSNITVVENPENTWTISAAISGGSTALSGLSDVSLSSPTSGQLLKHNGNKWVNRDSIKIIPFTIVGTNTITSGTKDTMFVNPYKLEIRSWVLTCSPSANVQLDILKINSGVPINSIISSNYPSVSGQFSASSTLDGWNTIIENNDVLKIKVNENSAANIITFQLICNERE
jgi:hypothetical protein